MHLGMTGFCDKNGKLKYRKAAECQRSCEIDEIRKNKAGKVEMTDRPIFIDGIKRINFLGGTIRLEMFYKHPTEYDEDNSELAGELIMSVDGFISVMGAMQQTADMLVEKGILQQHKAGEQSGEK